MSLFYHYTPGGSTGREITRVSCIFDPPRILREGEVVGGQRWYHSKERWWFHGLSIMTVALPFGRNLRSNVFDAQVNRGLWSLRAEICGEGVDRYKPNFSTIWENHVAIVYAKEILSIS